MKDVGIVRGSKEQAVPLVVGEDTVYVHTDIQEITVEEGGETRTDYQYHETQYEKNEYIHLMANQNAALEAELTDTQMALCDVYELIEQIGG